MSKYVPADTTLDFMIWRKRYLPPHLNQTPITHYRMIDYYLGVEEDGIGMIQCHRGLGKSQLAMEFSLFCICEGIERYVLFVGGTQELTNDLVGSAADLALDVPYITVKRAVEGVLEITNKLGQEAFLVAKSTGSKLRGVAKGKLRQRPTAIVVDDIVDDQLVLNRLRMARANRWMTSALFPTLVPGGKVFGSGTPMNDGDPFMTLCNNFGSFKIPLSLTSFPDRFTEGYIKRKKEQYLKLGSARDWKREFELVLTDSETQLFDMKKINYITETEIPKGLTWYLTADLAISQKASADYSAFTCVGISEQGQWYVYPVQEKLKPSESAGKIFELVNRFSILNIGCEAGATYLAMEEHLDALMADYQTFFYVEELKHGGIEKHARVKSLEPVINSGKLTIIDTGLDSEALVEQLELTDMESINSSHDDLIDALSYATQMVPRYCEPIPDTSFVSSYD